MISRRVDFLIYGVTFIVLMNLYGAPPIDKKEKKAKEDLYNTEGLTKEQAQDQEYFRYLTQVVGELEKDDEFKKILNNASEDDIRTGKIADYLDVVGNGIREKLDEVKRMEVEYQRELLRQNKDHMIGIDRNYWNPIHHEEKDKFSKDDLVKLLSKHNDMMEEHDKKRKEEFKKHEMEKEHQRRQKMANMTEEEKAKEEAKFKESHNKTHEKMHEPGHKAQMEEVWEKEDGLDPDSFDPKTFFNLHDKNSDHYLDMYELETLFLTDLDKVYNESDNSVDPKERKEETERMREHVMQTMDKNKDGLISLEEFMDETKSDDYEKDEEWKPLVDEDQYTDEELSEYEKMLAEEDKMREEEGQHGYEGEHGEVQGEGNH